MFAVTFCVCEATFLRQVHIFHVLGRLVALSLLYGRGNS